MTAIEKIKKMVDDKLLYARKIEKIDPKGEMRAERSFIGTELNAIGQTCYCMGIKLTIQFPDSCELTCIEDENEEMKDILSLLFAVKR